MAGAFAARVSVAPEAVAVVPYGVDLVRAAALPVLGLAAAAEALRGRKAAGKAILSV